MQKSIEPQTLALTVNETAQQLRVSRFTILKLIRGGEIPVVRAGKRLIVPTVSVLDFLGGQR
jgi:excisionase family DNA binding protein